jgi:photosystem II stability/assembly factor-like uncharacterized protein
MMNPILFVGTKQGALAFQRQDGRWQRLAHDLTAHRVNTLSTTGGVTLAGTPDGIYRSEDLGQTWRISSRGLTIPHVRWLAFHPSISNLAFAGTEPAAIFVSHDGGQSWHERPEVARLRDEHSWSLPYSPAAGCVRGFAFTAARGYAAVEVGGLLRTDDQGGTWHLVKGSTGDPYTMPEAFIHPDVHSVLVHGLSPDLVTAPTGGGLFRSANGGETWRSLYRCYCRAAWVQPDDPNHIIFGPADSVDRNGRIEETLDGGHTWRSASKGVQTPWSRHMVERFVQVGDDLIAVLSNGQLLAAPLGTLVWQPILPEVEGVLAASVMHT